MSILFRTAILSCLLAVLSACQQPPGDADQQPSETPGSAPAATAEAPSGTARQTASLVEYLNPDSHFESEAFSQIAVVQNRGATYYISGQIPVDNEYNILAPGDIRGQTRAVLNNLDMALTAAGISKDDVVKIGINLLSLEARDSFVVAEELVGYFEREEMPASTMTGAPFIVVDGVLIQIDAIAVTE